MIGFSIVHGSPQEIWGPVLNTDTLYVGQLVIATNEGVMPFAQASGLGDQSTKMEGVALISDGAAATCNNQLFGVVIGTNKRTPTYEKTNKAEYITYVDPNAATSSDYFGVEGVWGKGDLMAMVKIALITSESVLRGPISNAGVGTALTVETVASTNTTVTATIASAADFTPVASEATVYFRTGPAAGAYRIMDGTSTTALQWDIATVVAPAVGDRLVCANLRTLGQCKIMLDSESMYIDNSAALTSHYHLIDVLRLELSEAGNEYADFRFSTYSMLSFDDIAT